MKTIKNSIAFLTMLSLLMLIIGVVPASAAGQHLAMPLNTTTITCGYKNEAPGYYKLVPSHGTHYGTDMIGTPSSFYASGNGVVLGVNSTAANTGVGRWVAIKYTNVTGYGDLVVRYFHLASVNVAKGQVVNLNTIIGKYGNSGSLTMDAHLHVEVDTDVVYWEYTPTLSGAVDGLKGRSNGANDKTMLNPLNVFRLKKSAPENQTCTITYNADYRTRTSLPATFQ
jgi:murein DD-endopeptidase MepM/ murein hydrolase activator NlpD